jgi:hypothetical protein
MRKIGDFDWHQLSMWDYSPQNCIETYVRSGCGEHIFHYYLKRITAIVSDSQWKIETVTSIDNVPVDILNWMGGSAYLKEDGKTQRLVSVS